MLTDLTLPYGWISFELVPEVRLSEQGWSVVQLEPASLLPIMMHNEVLGELGLIGLHLVPAEAAELESTSLIRLRKGQVAIDGFEFHEVHCD